MNTKKNFITFHITSFLLGTFLFILLFHTPFCGQLVLFYRGILFLLIVSITLGVFLCWIKMKGTRAFDYKDILLSVVCVFCINLVFFTHLPVTADRSMSVFLLGYMNVNSSRAVSADELSRAFTDIYVVKQQALEKRFNEQIVTGTIVKESDGYKITPRGILLMRFYGWIADIFGISKSNVSM